MEALAIEDKTLYDFLELPQNASCIQLCSKAEAMAKKLPSKAKKQVKTEQFKNYANYAPTLYLKIRQLSANMTIT